MVVGDHAAADESGSSKEYYRTFLQELPTIEALAEVDDDRLMKLWEGLGYYNRARNLKKAAGEVVIEWQETSCRIR